MKQLETSDFTGFELLLQRKCH